MDSDNTILSIWHILYVMFVMDFFEKKVSHARNNYAHAVKFFFRQKPKKASQEYFRVKIFLSELKKPDTFLCETSIFNREVVSYAYFRFQKAVWH